MRIVILKTSIRKTFTGTLSLLPDIREYAGVKIWKLILILTLITNIDYIHREGTQPHPSTENWIKDLLSMVPPIRTRPSLPHSQFLPLGSLHNPLTYQRGDRMKTIITEPNWSHRSQPCLTQWNYETPCRATQDGRDMVESSDKAWSTGEGNGKPLQYSWLENPMNTEKVKRYDT